MSNKLSDSIALDGVLVKDLVEEIGGVPALLEAWGEAYSGSKSPSSATVYRWLGGEFPGNFANALRLALLLEVDPFCLLRPRRGSPARAINVIFQWVKEQAGTSESSQVLGDMFGWQAEWPAPYWRDGDKNKLFNWHVRTFNHDPTIRQGFYKQIGLVSDSVVAATRPQTFHFAYSGAGILNSASWLNYGFVVRDLDDVRLVHMHGHTDRYTAQAEAAPSFVETHFGPGAANFRVASLHPFELVLDDPPRASEMCVRFPG